MFKLTLYCLSVTVEDINLKIWRYKYFRHMCSHRCYFRCMAGAQHSVHLIFSALILFSYIVWLLWGKIPVRHTIWKIMFVLTKDDTIRKTWVQQILKRRKDLKWKKAIPKNCFVCSNHFIDGPPKKIFQVYFLL